MSHPPSPRGKFEVIKRHWLCVYLLCMTYGTSEPTEHWPGRVTNTTNVFIMRPM